MNQGVLDVRSPQLPENTNIVDRRREVALELEGSPVRGL
jgi:hypothetical protein